MTDSIYAAPKADLSMPASEIDPAFYVVSVRKFTILFIATLGMYEVFWFFRNWSLYKRRARADNGIDGTVWPLPRAIFSIFFIHSLFYAVDTHAKEKQRPLGWNVDGLATPLVLLIIVSYVLNRLSYKSIGSPITDILSLLILVPTWFALRKAQECINQSCGDPEGESNNHLTAANYFWIALGTVLWLLIAAGLLLPETEA